MPAEAAAAIGVSTVTLRVYARTGELPAAVTVPGRLRMYRRADVEAFARKRREGRTALGN